MRTTKPLHPATASADLLRPTLVPQVPIRVADRQTAPELFIGAPDEEVNEKMEFRFNVALSEPQIIEAGSLLETIHQMTNVVEGIISSLTPLLK